MIAPAAQPLPIETTNPGAPVPDEAIELIAGLLLAVVEEQDRDSVEVTA